MQSFVLRSRLFIAGGVLFAVMLGSGCRHTEAHQPSPMSLGSPQAPVTNIQTPEASSASKTPVKDAIEALLAQNESGGPIPRGTRLLHASVESKVATLDFSREFAALANSGDSNEAEAQRRLRTALSGISGVQKMRVTVEGKAFDSQATDWNTPFAIHDADGEPDVRKGESVER